MNDASLQSYNAIVERYITEAISLASQSPKSNKLKRRGIAGFAQLEGPTGGGKTSSLFRDGHGDGTSPVLETIKKLGYQAIFVTHRWNILHDVYHQASVAKDSAGSPITVSVLYAQDDNLVAAITQQPLPHEKNCQSAELPCPFTSIEAMRRDGSLFDKELTDQLLVACKKVKQLSSRIERMMGRAGSIYPQEYVGLDEEKLSRLCSQIERLLLKNMFTLEKEVRNQSSRYGADSEEACAAQKRLDNFRSNTWIRRVFPAIVWRDEHQHLLVMTTQKLFSSFYDGARKVRMSSGDLSGHIIFIDEFDYQADVLQQLLSQAQLVQEPPECLGQLLEAGKRLLKRLQYVDTDPIPTIYESLSQLIKDLEQALEDKRIDLSDARALLVPINQKDNFKTQFLFRSDHLVTSDRLSMQRVEHGYEIQVVKPGDPFGDDTIPVGDFLRLMEQFVRRFSLLVSDIAVAQDEAQDYLFKLSRLLFDSANDYRPSYYSSALPNVSMFSLPRSDLPELGQIRESNLLPNTHANVFGLANWLLKQNAADADIDPLRLQIRRAFLPTTPEGLLVSLCSRNLVFGLSATSFLERAIGSFDLRWVRNALMYVADARDASKGASFLGDQFNDRPESWFKKPIPFIQTIDHKTLQKNVIRQIVQTKKSIRKSKLSLHVDPDLPTEFAIDIEELTDSLPGAFFQSDDFPISEYVREHRFNVLVNLIGVIEKASKRSHHRGQLVFVNSIRYLKKWLFDDQAELSRSKQSWLSIAEPAYSERTLPEVFSEFEDVFVPVKAHDTELLICLLTAESQKRRSFYEAYQAAFETGRTVLVVTQTASATNGVNLDFTLPETQQQMDLTCLYLLEERHFYFSVSDSDDVGSEMAHAGYQLRNLEKLMRAGEISRDQHRKFILPVMENNRKGIAELNELYKRSADYIKNTAADIQQQVGRIERAWSEVPSVEIHLSEELAKVLTIFASTPEYINHKNQISDLNNQLLEELTSRQDSKDIDLLSMLMTPQQNGENAVEIVEMNLIPAIRASRESASDTKGISDLWSQLGKAVLQFDYAWKPSRNPFGLDCELYKWACFECPEDSINGPVWFNPDTWQFFSKKSSPEHVKFDPDKLYVHIRKSPTIIDWFNKRSYRTSIFPAANSLQEQYLFHPKIVQRLLQGRLGEEAIRALLSEKSITTSARVVDSRVMELFDFHVIGQPYYIDAKYWGSETLNDADEEYQNWLNCGAKDSDAPLGLIEKLRTIRAVLGSDAILVIANFIGRDKNNPLHCFDDKLNRVRDTEASIVILEGCLTSEPYEEFTLGFEQLTRLITNTTQKKQGEQ
ncbi:hypothetical protein [Rheinheimera sp. NSM]|uniref:hypothetical protein n=1 Tax=Rheinheimera sp. NSM TaxID=3457884 RepID=UPI004035C7BC